MYMFDVIIWFKLDKSAPLFFNKYIIFVTVIVMQLV